MSNLNKHWSLPNRILPGNLSASRPSSPAPSVNNSRPSTPTGKTPKVVRLPGFQVGLPNREKNGTPIQYVFGKGRKSRRNRKGRKATRKASRKNTRRNRKN